MQLYTKRSVNMNFIRTCIIIFILTFSFFNQSASQKKTEKVPDEIYSRLFEIYKGTDKVVLLKFVEAIPFSRNHSFQWKPFLPVEAYLQRKPFLVMEAVLFNGSRFFQLKLILLVETIYFGENISCSQNIACSVSHSIEWKQLLLVETIPLSGSRSFLLKLFPIVETIPSSVGHSFQQKSFLLVEAIPFSGSHSF